MKKGKYSVRLLRLIVVANVLVGHFLASASHPQMESEFKVRNGSTLWSNVIDVRILVETAEESLERLKSVLRGQGFNPNEDPDFKTQQRHYRDLKRWQGALDQHYRSALVAYSKFSIQPTEEALETTDRIVSEGVLYAQAILNDGDPDKPTEPKIVAEFKQEEGRGLWEGVKSAEAGVNVHANKLARLENLLRGKGSAPGQDADYSRLSLQMGKKREGLVKLRGHYGAALLAFEKYKLFGVKFRAPMDKALVGGIMYAKALLENDGVPPPPPPPSPPPLPQHSAKTVKIWNRLSDLRNQLQLPTTTILAGEFGRADMRGIHVVNGQQAGDSDNVYLKIEGSEKLMWWRYFNDNQRKRSVILYFRENDSRLVGWEWNERVPENEMLGAPKDYSQKASSVFRSGSGRGLQGEIVAQLDRVEEEKKRLDQFGRALKQADSEFKNFLKWRDAWTRLKTRTEREPEKKMREAFLAHHKNKLLKTRAGEAAVQQTLGEGSKLVRAIWEEYQQAKVEIANPLPKLKVSIAGQAALAPGQKAVYTGVFKPVDSSLNVAALGLTYEWYIFRHGEKFDIAKHLVGRVDRAEHIFLFAGAYQVWFVVRLEKRLVASQAVNVNVVKPKKTAGSVTNVNAKFGIVDIDIGGTDTIVGAKYIVRREGKLVGRIIVGRLGQGKSLCRLDKSNSPGQPQVGDQVTLVE